MPDRSQGNYWGQLMAAAQDGQGGPYRRLLDELRYWLTGFYARRLPPADVEDAVQDTLIAIHDKRHTYDRERPFKPWLVAVARYKWIDRLRSMTRTRTDLLEDDVAVDDHEAAMTSAAVLDQLLGELKPAQQAVIRLVKLQGYSIEEASAYTGQSSSLVKVNIHRGLARMAMMIGRQSAVD